MRTFFELLQKAEKLVFEVGWHAGYNARILDEKRTSRWIYPFESIPGPSTPEAAIHELEQQRRADQH